VTKWPTDISEWCQHYHRHHRQWHVLHWFKWSKCYHSQQCSYSEALCPLQVCALDHFWWYSLLDLLLDVADLSISASAIVDEQLTFSVQLQVNLSNIMKPNGLWCPCGNHQDWSYSIACIILWFYWDTFQQGKCDWNICHLLAQVP